MKLLVTAGNTQSPIDKVRCITNIFSGRTGAQIAMEAAVRGHAVTLATSSPETVESSPQELRILTYRQFEELWSIMSHEIQRQPFDGIIHCAAVNDYSSGGIFARADGTFFDTEDGRWLGTEPRLESRDAGKVKSDEPELWLRLVRNPKIVDRLRSGWGFTGVLVKFKLEVDVTDEALLDIAEKSRIQSAANLMVANTLEGMQAWAYVGPLENRYEKVPRRELAVRLITELERLHKAK